MVNYLGVKTDGAYMASSGALDNNILEMSFKGHELNEKILGYSFSINDDVEYYIDDEKVSEEEYNDFLTDFFDKEDVNRHRFPSNSGQ